MSTGNVALQANFKTPSGALLNVYGQTADEFEFNLKAFGALLDIINATDKAVQAASTSAVAQVQASLGATVTSPAPQVSVSAPPQVSISAPVETPAPNTGAPSCRHGVMQFVDGTKKGKTWKGYFCPQPKEATDKCSPIFNKG
jgi:hypothetical protein